MKVRQLLSDAFHRNASSTSEANSAGNKAGHEAAASNFRESPGSEMLQWLRDHAVIAGAGTLAAASLAPLAAAPAAVVFDIAQAPGVDAALTSVPTETKVFNAREYVKTWNADQHTYKLGDVSQFISNEKMVELEKWLDTNGQHWSVFLVEDASNLRYTDATGETYFGFEAVQHGLGEELTGQTGFSELKDARTQQADGGFLIIEFQGRNLGYYGSATQDRYGLGDAQWAGDLDEYAIAAMREGMNVSRAVQDTVGYINSELSRRIADEAAQQEQAIKAAKLSVQSAQGKVGQLDQASQNFRAAHPGADGDMARPNIEAMRSQLTLASAKIDAGKVDEAQKLAVSVEATATVQLEAIRGADSAPASIAAVRAGIEAQQQREHASAGAEDLALAEKKLAQAETLLNRGQSAYQEQLREAQSLVQAAQSKIEDAARAETVGQALMTGLAFAAVAGVTGLGVTANVKRRGVKTEAEEQLEKWSGALAEKLSALFVLMNEVEATVGSSQDEAAASYAGESLALALSIIRDVDEMMVMVHQAGKNKDLAAAQIHPDALFEKVKNLFSKGNYQEGLALLKDQQVQFEPESAAEIVLVGPKSLEKRLFGTEALQPFSMSFEELIAGFEERGLRAIEHVKKMESVDQVLDAELKAIAAAASQTRAEQTALSEGDALFRATELFGTLLPALDAKLAEADKLGAGSEKRDPVAAMKGPAAVARRQASNAAALSVFFKESHQTTVPGIRTQASELVQKGIATAWVGQRLVALSLAAEELAKASVDQTPEQVGEALGSISNDLKILEQDARTAIDLQRSLGSNLPQTEQLVARAKAELSKSLGLPETELLQESGNAPDVLVRQATQRRAEALQLLSSGSIAEASKAGDEVEALLSRASSIVEATRAAATSHVEQVKKLKAETARLESVLPEHVKTVSGLEATYAESAVRSRSSGQPLRNNLEVVRKGIAAAKTKTEAAEKAFQRGAVLEAAELLNQVAGHQASGRQDLKEIVDHAAALKQTVSANATMLQKLQGQVAEGKQVREEARTTRPTQKLYDQASEAVATARKSVEARQGDPFKAAQALSVAQSALKSFVDGVEVDRRAFQEAQSSITAASNVVEDGIQKAARGSDGVVTGGMRDVQGRLTTARSGVSRLREGLGQAHGDWTQLREEAERLSSEARTWVSSLQREFDRVQAARSEIAEAERAVSRARADPEVSGSPGSSSLQNARSALASGDVDRAIQYADAAEREAYRAIEYADQIRAERMRREAEERRRQEEARRRAEAARREEEQRRAAERSRQEQAERRRRDDANRRRSNSGVGSSSGGSSSRNNSGVGSSKW